MKILYLCLKNMASIYSSMRRKTIEIDISKSKNRVILLVGDNGSGKTSLISHLHPFPYPGNMDVRNNTNLIIEGENGYKEIHIKDDDILYVIKHHYINSKNGISVKSFISKNDIELNPNGNVNSFKECILMEFLLELDFLKLIRLGSNVTNFIDMKATERKGFTSDLLSDIDIYSQFYKKINEDSKLLRVMLKSVVDKIDKLRIIDIKELKNEIKKLELELNKLKEHRENNIGLIWKYNTTIESIIPDSIESFNNDLKSHIELLKDIHIEIQSIKKKKSKMNLIIIGNVSDNIKELDKNIYNSNSKIESNKNMISFYITQLDKLYLKREELDNELKYLISEVEYIKLNDFYIELNNKQSNYKKIFRDFNPKCTKEELLRALRLMQEINNIISNIYTFNSNAVIEVINHIINKSNLDGIIKENILRIDDKINKNNIKLMNLNESGFTNKGLFVMFKTPGCKENECPYINFYNRYSSKTETPIEKLNQENNKLETRREYYITMDSISKNMNYIYLLIKTNKELLDKLPEEFFNINNLLNSIKEYITFFDEEKITEYISVLEDYEDYLSINDKIKEIKREMIFIEKNSKSLKVLQDEINKINDDILSLENQISDLKDNTNQLNITIDKYNNTKELYLSYTFLNNGLILLEERYDEIDKYIKDKKNKLQETEVYFNRINIYKKEISNYDVQIKKIENEINNIKFKIREFKSLNEERNILEEQFDEISLIKESVSSNKGIPLLFIQLYLKNTKMIVNNLLDFIYKGELEIDDFEINEKEFKIPYIKNNMKIDDIIHTSQGERSFVSIALSFALIEQSIKKYNIMLLDEIDATLDQKNRIMFLNILDIQLDIIKAEQIFLITHNNMFDSYPVDLILTSNVELDNYKNKNIIFK